MTEDLVLFPDLRGQVFFDMGRKIICISVSSDIYTINLCLKYVLQMSKKKNKYLEELLLSNSSSLYSNTFFKIILLPLHLEKMGWSAWLQYLSMIIHQVHGWQWRTTYPSAAKITGCHSVLKTILVWQRILNGEDQCSMWQSPQPGSDFQNQTQTPKTQNNKLNQNQDKVLLNFQKCGGEIYYGVLPFGRQMWKLSPNK